jgi:hypothetical protein
MLLITANPTTGATKTKSTAETIRRFTFDAVLNVGLQFPPDWLPARPNRLCHFADSDSEFRAGV